MEIRNPLNPAGSLALNSRWAYLLWLTAILLAAVLNTLPISPGAIEFEFHPLQVLSQWSATEKQWAAFGLGLDFLFMPVYSSSIFILCLAFSRAQAHGRNQLGSGSLSARLSLLAWLGIALAWAQLIAVALDTAENISLLSLLIDSHSEHAAQIAQRSIGFTIVKFAIILAGVPIYPIACLIQRLSSRSPGDKPV